jgi:hypothetical protein
MRAWFSRLTVALLSIGLMQAGAAYCCWTPESGNARAAQDCHPAPRSSHVGCAPADAVKGVATRSLSTHDRLRVTGVVAVLPKCSILHVALVTAVDARDGAAWFADDLFLRIRVLLI